MRVVPWKPSSFKCELGLLLVGQDCSCHCKVTKVTCETPCASGWDTSVNWYLDWEKRQITEEGWRQRERETENRKKKNKEGNKRLESNRRSLGNRLKRDIKQTHRCMMVIAAVHYDKGAPSFTSTTPSAVTLFEQYFLAWSVSYLLTGRRQGLWPILWPTSWGQSRHFGFTFWEQSMWSIAPQKVERLSGSVPVAKQVPRMCNRSELQCTHTHSLTHTQTHTHLW